jgi:hypothetical protein
MPPPVPPSVNDGPDHRREADFLLHGERLVEVVRDAGARRAQADARHRGLELLAVLGLVDRFFRRADQLDVELRQHALAREIQRAVERRLAAHRRASSASGRSRSMIFAIIGQLMGSMYVTSAISGVGHDRRRIRVDEDDPVAFLLERLAGLRARVVELARLPDDDRAGADDQDRLDVGALRHYFCSIILTKRSKR